mgnify:CR=1 FL=1
MLKILTPLMIVTLVLLAGVSPVLAEGVDDWNVYGVDVKTPWVFVDTSVPTCDASVIPDLVAARTSGDVYLLDLKVRTLGLIGLKRLAVLGAQAEYCVY